jgi:integrase
LVAFTLGNGKRTLRSTKQTDRKLAERIGGRWEQAAELARRGELTETRAREVVNDILKSVDEGPIRKESTRKFFEGWLEGKQITESTAKLYKKGVKRFLKELGERADKPIELLTAEDVKRFQALRSKDQVSAATVKIDLKTVRAVLASAQRQGLIVRNPAEEVDLPKAKSHEREVFTHEDVRTLLEAASPDWKTAILLGYYVGARLGDIISLSWANVDLDKGVLFYNQRKTDKRVEVPIHPDLEEHLLAIAGDNPRGLLCQSLGSMRMGGGAGLSMQFAGLMARVGMDQHKVEVSKKRMFSRLSFHSLRHSFTSALANAGVSPEIRQKLTGHKSIDVHQRYTHLELEPLQRAIGALPSFSRPGAQG